MARRHIVLAAAPGVLALALATIALLDTDGAPVSAPAPMATVAPADEPSFADLYARVDGAVARIDARRGPDAPPFGNGRRVATGAAWLFDDDGHVVTNAHVVERARSASLRFGRSARRLDARIVGSDPATDLAVLQVDSARLRGERPLPLAAAGSVRVGDPVLALGTPYRLQSSASAGIVSATGREITGLTGRSVPDAIQTDAAVNPGNSGGPLIDTRGRVVGVNTQGRAAGVSFAVGADTIRRIVPQLIRDGRARTAMIGVAHGEVRAAGTPLTAVTAGGPADRAGIRRRDVVTRVGDRPTVTDGALASAVAALKPGQRVTIGIRRAGREREVVVRAAAAPGGRD
ncbi:MAG: HtrA protease/chaperone protein [uncultured Solirubrobacteraceae bacterium]|uniref:HtrA protease/chaperone protein n=1 Tax=uncultured Solirubrobacteraceae bacterium TaxID=1162706 RepID=A0A6J4R8H1_9ACTN|nr:MAG: HtrA protease/chaperone protein [uncultured Solirubrobacteraceae bacterium]